MWLTRKRSDSHIGCWQLVIVGHCSSWLGAVVAVAVAVVAVVVAVLVAVVVVLVVVAVVAAAAAGGSLHLHGLGDFHCHSSSFGVNLTFRPPPMATAA